MASITPHKIIRSHRKSIGLHITQEAQLIVHAPYLLPKFFIDNFLQEKEEWIIKKVIEVKKNYLQKKNFTEGEKFFYLGTQLTVTFVNAIEISVTEKKLLFPSMLVFRWQKELQNWYIKQAKKIITERIRYHAQKMKTEYAGLIFSDTKSKWGTCFPDNSLQFNWRLIMAPLMVIDYVIIHELVHTTEKNHSRSFWNKVRLFTPAYRQHREWLNKNGHTLTSIV